MKLNAKLSLSLIFVLVIVLGGVQAVQFTKSREYITKLAQANRELLREGQIQRAKDVFTSVEQGIEGSLIRGEMEKFARLLEANTKIKGLAEYSLYTPEGEVSHSSDPKFIGKTMASALLTKMRGQHEITFNETDQDYEIYKPYKANADCLRCHPAWRLGQLGGVSYFRFSKTALKSAEATSNAILKQASDSFIVISAAALVVVILAFLGGMFLTVRRFVARPLGRMVDALHNYDVDLTREMPVETSDEIGVAAQLLNRFVSKLNQVIGSAQEAAEVVGDQAGRQAAAVEQTSASAAELAAATSDHADHAQTARDLMNQVSKGFAKADQSLSKLTASMTELSESSAQVARIMKTIDEIAFQTNLLALNAAVEAARAGEAGAGFAVVADEVRSLALRSAEAARETTDLIQGTVDSIAAGEELVLSTGEVFRGLKTGADQAGALVREMAQTSRGQAESIDQVRNTLMDIDAATQESSSRADLLNQTMSTFETTYTRKKKD